MTGQNDREARGRGATDDETISLILQLHREPKADGTRRSQRDIARECKALGRPISASVVNRIISEAHAETIGAATSEIRERIVGSADVNLARIDEMAELLATVALTGMFPEHEDQAELLAAATTDEQRERIFSSRIANAAQRVAAARESVAASSQTLAVVGLGNDKKLTSDDAVAAVDHIYGLGDEEDRDASQADALPKALVS